MGGGLVFRPSCGGCAGENSSSLLTLDSAGLGLVSFEKRALLSYLSQRGGLRAWGLSAWRHHGGDLRLELGYLVLVEEE